MSWGSHKLEFYALGRIPNAHEYVTPGGGTLTVPMWAVSSAIGAGYRFGGYLLRECRYVRTVGRKVEEEVYPNLFTNQGIEGIAKMLIDSAAAYDTGIKRVEFGDGDGAAVTPTVDGTALVDAASVRFACNAPTQSAGVIEVVTAVTVAGGGNIYVREAGIFIADNTATRAAGDLLAWSAMDHDNSGGGAADFTDTWTGSLARLVGA